MNSMLEGFAIIQFFRSSLGFVLTAICWGCTNPFIKNGSSGLANIKRNSWLRQTIAEILFLFSNWKYVLPLVVNLSGSAVYYYTLSDADITVAVPIVNSLALVFTQLTEFLFLSKPTTKGELLGIAMVVVGVSLCISG